jgi:diguanylate cyclase (GGDEF)-like protein
MKKDTGNLRRAVGLVEIEAARELYKTLPPTLISGVCFAVVTAAILAQTPSRILWIAMGLGYVALLWRIGVILIFRKQVTSPSFERTQVRKVLLPFAIGHLLYAFALGGFSAGTYFSGTPEARLLVVALLLGYGAGIAIYLPLRPWTGVSCLLIAVLPASIFQASMQGPLDFATAVLLVLMLTGAIGRMFQVNRMVSELIVRRDAFSILARSDPLTGLPNRLALDEWHAARQMQTDGEDLAILFLDLDRFKPVNDLYGHQVGDELLVAVGKRLNALLRQRDFMARIGGDEFVIIGAGIGDQKAAEIFAERIVEAISKPFVIAGNEITIGGSVGYVLGSDSDEKLDQLLTMADEAMYQVKHTARRVAAYVPAMA